MAFRCGIIGMASWYSQAFAGALRSMPREAELVALADLGQAPDVISALTGKTPKEWAAHFEAKLYADPEEMIRAEGLDVAFVCVHDCDKARYAELAARAGCHVYVAKPLCIGTEAALRLAAVATETGRVIGTLEPGRYDGAIRQAWNRVQAGEVGEVISARSWIQHGQPRDMDYANSVEFSPESGGTLYSLGVYAAGLLNWFMKGQVTQAWAVAGNYNTPWYPHFDQMKGTVTYEDGRIGSTDIYFSTPCAAPAWEMEVVGTKGILRINQDVFEGTIYTTDRGVIPFYRNQNDVIREAVGSFLDSLQAGEELDLPLAEAVEIIRVCEAWGRSIERGAPVAVER